MPHAFLMEAGRWSLQGNWLERSGVPLPVKGKTLVAWSRDNWFTIVTQLMFPGSERDRVSLQYRGRLDAGERSYTFVLQHSLLGRGEGEGWISPGSIIQRYWMLGDRYRRSGFETLYRMENEQYCLSSGILSGHYLISTMEAILERESGTKD